MMAFVAGFALDITLGVVAMCIVAAGRDGR